MRACLSSNPAKVLQQITDKKSGKSFNVNACKSYSAQTFVVSKESNSSRNIFSINNNNFLHENNMSTIRKQLSTAPINGKRFNIMNEVKSTLPVNNDDEKKKVQKMLTGKVDTEKIVHTEDVSDDGFIAL